MRIFKVIVTVGITAATTIMSSCQKADWADSTNVETYVEPHVDYDGSGLSAEEYVDMGTSVLWAKANLGGQEPVDAGNFYGWGETETKSEYRISRYKWSEFYDLRKFPPVTGDSTFFYTKYVDNDIVSDGLYRLLPEDDAVTVALGEGYRTPTRDEWQELIDATRITWVHYNGIPGALLESEKTGNRLFLRGCGLRMANVKHSCSSTVNAWYNCSYPQAYYFSSDLYATNREEGTKDSEYPEHDDPEYDYGDRNDPKAGGFAHATIFYARHDDAGISKANRCFGLSIRPVKEK